MPGHQDSNAGKWAHLQLCALSSAPSSEGKCTHLSFQEQSGEEKGLLQRELCQSLLLNRKVGTGKSWKASVQGGLHDETLKGGADSLKRQTVNIVTGRGHFAMHACNINLIEENGLCAWVPNLSPKCHPSICRGLGAADGISNEQALTKLSQHNQQQSPS